MEWKDIKDYEGLYQISNTGLVKAMAKTWLSGEYRNSLRSKPETIIKCSIKPNGYKQCTLSKNGKVLNKRINRLVAEAFIPNPENKPEVNHKDGVKSNNHVSNLEWCTRQENLLHAYKNGLLKPARGENQGNSKLKNKVVDEIREKYSTGNYTYKQLADEYDIYFGHVGKIIRKEIRYGN